MIIFYNRNKGRLTDDKSKSSRHSKERRSRSPFADKNKHAKELLPSNKSRRSRTPEKLRSKKDTTPIANRHQDKHFSSNKVKEPEKKDRDSHKTEKSKVLHHFHSIRISEGFYFIFKKYFNTFVFNNNCCYL